MIRTAIFVEGQTELIFMREYLLKMFDYQNVWIECYTLFNDNNHTPTEYSFPNQNAGYYFQIINVGNDNAVLTRVLNREQYLWNSGFHMIFAVRDMYSKAYREVVQNSTISNDVNVRFIEGIRNIINTRAKRPDNIYFHFAIMEIESWIIGIRSCFGRMHQQLTDAALTEHVKLDIHADPEVTYFHPSQILKEIFALAGGNYTKAACEVNAIMGNICKDDFINLSQSGKCASFKAVYDTLIPN